MLPAEETRPTVRCPNCSLVQFWPPEKKKCARCAHRPEIVAEKATEIEAAPIAKRQRPTGFDKVAWGQRVKNLRLSRGMTQRHLAGLMDCPRSYITKIERGRLAPQPASIEKLARCLGTGAAILLDERIHDRDVADMTMEQWSEHQRFLGEIAAELPALGTQDRQIILGAIQAMQRGQYTLQEWVRV